MKMNVFDCPYVFFTYMYIIFVLQNKARAKLMEEEMTYGSKPTTPAKRRFIGTPSKTPTNKQRRVSVD